VLQFKETMTDFFTLLKNLFLSINHHTQELGSIISEWLGSFVAEVKKINNEEKVANCPSALIDRSQNQLSKILIFHPKPLPRWYCETMDRLRLDVHSLSPTEVSRELNALQEKVNAYCQIGGVNE